MSPNLRVTLNVILVLVGTGLIGIIGSDLAVDMHRYDLAPLIDNGSLVAAGLLLLLVMIDYASRVTTRQPSRPVSRAGGSRPPASGAVRPGATRHDSQAPRSQPARPVSLAALNPADRAAVMAEALALTQSGVQAGGIGWGGAGPSSAKSVSRAPALPGPAPISGQLPRP